MAFALPGTYYRLIGCVIDRDHEAVGRLIRTVEPALFDEELSPPVYRCAEMGEPDLLRQFLAAGWQPETFCGVDPLRIAAERGHMECVRTLLDHGDPVDGTDDMIDPIEAALQHQQLETAAFLQTKGACPSDRSIARLLSIDAEFPLSSLIWALDHGWEDIDGDALVASARQQDHTALRRVLAAGIGPNRRNPAGISALARIATSGRDDFVRIAIEYGPVEKLTPADERWLTTRGIAGDERLLTDLRRQITAAMIDTKVPPARRSVHRRQL